MNRIVLNHIIEKRKEDNTMKQIQHLFKLLVVTLCLSACSHKDNKPQDTPPSSQISINLDAKNGILAYDTIEIIALILPENEVLADISKIQCVNSRFFVMDDRQNLLMIFAMNGQYEGKLDRKGNGPGEYSDITDFDVTSDGKLYIFDVNQRKIHIYSSDSLNPISDIPIECRGIKFAVADSANFYFENVHVEKGKRSKLVRYNSNNSKSETIMDYTRANEYRAVGKGRSHLWRSGSTILFYDRFSPNIYSLSDSSIEIKFTLETKNLPDESQIQRLIDESKANPGQRSRENTQIIRDIQDVFITPDFTSIKVNSIPPQQLFIDNVSSEVLEVAFDERFNHCKPGAMGVAGDSFITIRYTPNSEIPSIVMYKLKRDMN